MATDISNRQFISFRINAAEDENVFILFRL